MKKTGSIAAAIIVLFIIGTIMTQTKVKGLEKDLIQSVKRGDYYTAIDDADEIKYQGRNLSKKISKLIEDIKLYLAAVEELEKHSEMNLGRVKAILDAMNGSYKKYRTFKSDVKDLKEKVKELEAYGNEGVKLTKKIEKLLAKGKQEEVRELIEEYKSDEKYEYMPTSLRDSLSNYLNQTR